MAQPVQVVNQTQDILSFTIAQHMGLSEVTTAPAPGGVQWNCLAIIQKSAIVSAMITQIIAHHRVGTGKQG
jgi:hypothetical protein